MKEKKFNTWRIVWIIGIYAVLVLLLYLVVLYKVKWEDRDLNKYLYFYDCSHELCTTDTETNDSYSKVLCDNDVCPYITEKNNDIVILNGKNNNYLYNYKKGTVIDDNYVSYHFINDDYLIVTNNDGLYGVISNDGKVAVDFGEKEIVNYSDDFVVFKAGGMYGIENVKRDILIDAKYKDISLINDQIFAYKDNDNGYYIASYDKLIPISNTIYDYITAYNDLIFTIKDKQIDIFDINLKSKLLMKIDTYYSYKTIKEINSLNLYIKDNLLHFTVYLGNDNYIYYIYDIKNNKIYS